MPSCRVWTRRRTRWPSAWVTPVHTLTSRRSRSACPSGPARGRTSNCPFNGACTWSAPTAHSTTASSSTRPASRPCGPWPRVSWRPSPTPVRRVRRRRSSPTAPTSAASCRGWRSASPTWARRCSRSPIGSSTYSPARGAGTRIRPCTAPGRSKLSCLRWRRTSTTRAWQTCATAVRLRTRICSSSTATSKTSRAPPLRRRNSPRRVAPRCGRLCSPIARKTL